MSNARNLADIVTGNFDVPLGALDNVPPSNDASALTTGTLGTSRLPAGSVLQVKQITSASIVSTTNSSFTDTGISWTFDNPLLAGSKVLVSLDVVMGQQYAGSWASLAYVTIYEGAINRGDTLHGIAGSAANLGGAASGTAMQYDVERMGGSCVFTPSSTTPTIQLYFRTSDPNTGIQLNSSWNNGDANYRSTLTGFIMEIA
jgi:hypothetical protein